jgi:sialate O-acetylesterase
MRILLIFSLFASMSWAGVEVAPLFGDHAVLQRERPVPVWGRAAAGEEVSVTFGAQHVSAKTDPEGRWRVELAPMAAQNTGIDLVVAGSNRLVFHDVVVGEVWLCTGQSNMGFTLSRALNAREEIAGSANPRLRELVIRNGAAESPVEGAKTSGWQVATPDTTPTFTAVGYFFGKELVQSLDVPVGLIHSTVGGTPVEAWMNSAAFASDPGFAAVAERSRAEDQAMAAARLKAWNQAEAKAIAAGSEALVKFKTETPKPAPYAPKVPMVLFNGKIAPIKPYAFRGAVWYQGEANAARPQEYHGLFAAMITSWRNYFGAGDFPFYWVQLPNFAAGDAAGTTWAAMREAQTQTLSLPNTGQAIAVDVGEADNLHPLNKRPVGHRLAILAEAHVYQLPTEFSGPVFKSMDRAGQTLVVTFDHADGLKARGNQLPAVQVAGADKVFHSAKAHITDGKLVASSADVLEPVAIRYAWTNAPDATLYNGADLPAAPFRSDRW